MELQYSPSLTHQGCSERDIDPLGHLNAKDPERTMDQSNSGLSLCTHFWLTEQFLKSRQFPAFILHVNYYYGC